MVHILYINRDAAIQESEIGGKLAIYNKAHLNLYETNNKNLELQKLEHITVRLNNIGPDIHTKVQDARMILVEQNEKILPIGDLSANYQKCGPLNQNNNGNKLKNLQSRTRLIFYVTDKLMRVPDKGGQR